MKLKASFKGVAQNGSLIQRKRQVVPASLSVHSLSIFFEDNVDAGEKTIVLALNDEILFSGQINTGTPLIFDRPLTIRPGIPAISVIASPFETGRTIAGHVIVEASLGFKRPI